MQNKLNQPHPFRSAKSVRRFGRQGRTKASLFQLNAAYFDANSNPPSTHGSPALQPSNTANPVDPDYDEGYSGSPRKASKRRLGDGSSKYQANKIAEEKPITTTGLDRWKRTFGIVRSSVTCLDEIEPSPGRDRASSEEFKEPIKSQAASVNDDDDSSDSEEAMIHAGRRDVRSSWGVFYPESTFRVVWELVGLLFLLIQALTTPFIIAFPITTDAAWDVFEVILDCFFMVDIGTSACVTLVVVCFNTGFYREGKLVMRRAEIAWNYLGSWLLLDLTATFPYTWVFNGCVGDNCSSVQKLC